MTNFLGSELVRSFDYTNAKQDRTAHKIEVVNGRTYAKFGTATSTSVVGDLYRVCDPSDKSFNYVLLIGVARQHPTDVKINSETGIEIAAENAKINPIAQIKLARKISYNEFRSLAELYINTLPVQFVKTASELRKNIA